MSTLSKILVNSSQNFRFLDVDKYDHSSDGSHFVLSRLRKHCQYEIVVQAINVFGEGPLSKPSLGRTMEDVPDGPPEKVHCVALTSSTIQVSWHPPEIHLRNGIIKGYKVLYAPHPGRVPSASLPVPKISRLSTVTTVLENLRKFTNYSIQVLAFTAAGDGVYSKQIDCTTHSDGEFMANLMLISSGAAAKVAKAADRGREGHTVANKPSARQRNNNLAGWLPDKVPANFKPTLPPVATRAVSVTGHHFSAYVPPLHE